MNTIFRITPMDSKGEQDGNFSFTINKMDAFRAIADGHVVDIMEGTWQAAQVDIRPI